ncbi:hypothetical protein EDF78_11211 [Rahnella sp. BIGb0236]|nr:hypothetical protein EDF78_11211 [Rahnella sp. BIGb0236]
MRHVNHGLRFCDETYMDSISANSPLPEPEKNTAICTESFEVRVSVRPLRTVIVMAVYDAKNREYALIKCD